MELPRLNYTLVLAVSSLIFAVILLFLFKNDRVYQDQKKQVMRLAALGTGVSVDAAAKKIGCSSGRAKKIIDDCVDRGDLRRVGENFVVNRW